MPISKLYTLSVILICIGVAIKGDISDALMTGGIFILIAVIAKTLE